jgi:hypothetical protein
MPFQPENCIPVSSFNCGVPAPVYISINPKSNYLWFNPITKELKVLESTTWKLVSTSAQTVPPPATVSVSPPQNPIQGNLWYDPNTGNLSVWYVDVDGGQWVSTSIPGPQGPEGPQGPQGPIRVGEVLIDATTEGTIYVGTAPLGSTPSENVWDITRTIYDSSGVRISKGTATGVNWTDRASHIYT